MNMFVLLGLSVLATAAATSVSLDDETSLMQLQHRASPQRKGMGTAMPGREFDIPWHSPTGQGIGRRFLGADPSASEELCEDDAYQPSLLELDWKYNAKEWTDDYWASHAFDKLTGGQVATGKNPDSCKQMKPEDANAWIEQNANGKHNPKLFSMVCRKGQAPQYIEPLAGILRDPRFGCQNRNFTDLFSVDWLVFPSNDDHADSSAKKCANEGEMCSCLGKVTYGKRFKNGATNALRAENVVSFAEMRNDRVMSKIVQGKVMCGPQSMGGDPVPNEHKHCFCQEGQGHKVLAPGAKSRFYDAGGSHFGDALQFFLETYRGHGIPFDEVYAWEYAKQGKEKYWAGVPPELRLFWEPRVTFYDGIGVDSDRNSEHNPVSRVFKDCKPEDFCVLKLDIDNPSIESPLAAQVVEMESESKAKLDEFFFEQHVTGKNGGPMMPWWRCDTKGSCDGTFEDSYQLFSDLRKLGIRAHSWV